MVQNEPDWRGSRPVWQLMVLQVGRLRMALGLGFIGCMAGLRSWCQVFQLSALTSLYSALVGGAAAAGEALVSYLLASAALLLLYWVREGGSIRMELAVRQALTVGALDRYLAKRSYWSIRHGRAIDNPDQRITEDAAETAQHSVMLTMSFVGEAISLASFLAVLVGASRFLDLDVPSLPISAHWLMPALALATAGFGTGVGLWLGRRLSLLSHCKERAEAILRRDLVVVREQAEQIAAMQEEPLRQEELKRGLSNVLRWQQGWLLSRMRLEAFRMTERDLTKLLPLAVVAWVALPQLAMGQVIQLVGAFVAVVDSGQWLVRYLSSVRLLKAAAWRLGTFLRAVTSTNDGGPTGNEPIAERCLTWANEILTLPLQNNDWVILEGPSGVGKSSLLRLLGDKLADAVCVPQQLRLPVGTLRRWCDPRSRLATGVLEQHFQEVGLSHLTSMLDEDRPWGEQLSGGEQARVAIVRAVLMQSKWLLLDEPLAPLDRESAVQLLSWMQATSQSRVIVATHRDAHQMATSWRLRLCAFEGMTQARDSSPL